MDAFEALDAAAAEVERRLYVVNAEQWQLPTPCALWTVRDLVNHVVATGRMYVRMLDGCSSQDAKAILTSDALGPDPVVDLRTTAAAVKDAFHRPGALDQLCHHPSRDVVGRELLGFRIVDNAVHAWDLARSIGADEHLDEDLVREAWKIIEPIAAGLGGGGGFGAGASGLIGAQARLQIRLLDAVGRRP